MDHREVDERYMTDRFEQSILTVVDGHQPVTAPEIAARLNVHPVRVQRHCDMLQQRGRLRQVSSGVYVSTTQNNHIASD